MSSCFSFKGFICWSSTLASSMVVIVQKFVGGVVQFIHLCILGNKETVLLHPKTSHCTPTVMRDGVFLLLYFKLVSICLVACLHCISVTVVLSCVSLHCYGDACTHYGVSLNEWAAHRWFLMLSWRTDLAGMHCSISNRVRQPGWLHGHRLSLNREPNPSHV